MRKPLLDTSFIKCLCPFCLEEFYPGDCDIFSGVANGKLLKPAPVGKQQHKSRIHPEPLTGHTYTSELAYRQCPHCRKPLPYNIESVRKVNIAIVGDASSGKSWYVAALIHQLEEGQWMTQDHYVRVSCLNPNLRREYYYYWLEYKKPSQTIPMEPLIFELSMAMSPNQPSKKVNLIFYDTISSNSPTQGEMTLFNRCISNADALVYLIDPATIPGLASYLPSHLQHRRQMEQSISFNDILRILNEQKRSRSLPIAVTISKSDLLQFVRPLRLSYAIFQDCAYDNGFNVQILEENSNELREFVAEHGVHDLLNVVQNLPNIRFFAASATAHSANEEGLFSEIEPCRCLDPVLWILHQLGIMSFE